jgi:hypothetical protein
VPPRASAKERIKRATERLIAELGACDIATVEATALAAMPDEEPRSGSKPLAFLCDPAGGRWLFKATARELAAAEQSAFELRRLGHRPSVAARALELELPELGRVTGVLKPFIRFDLADELPANSSLWTELQRGVMLREHAWEWLLDDLDANRGQYALLGPERYPVKLDWDRAFSSRVPGPPSRFDKYKPMLPNARSFLYADWMERRVELELGLLTAEARHIAAIPGERVRRILQQHAERCEMSPEQARSFVAEVMLRHARAPRAFDRFISQLRHERDALSPDQAAGLAMILRAGGVRAWRWWQLLLDGVFRGPLGDVARGALRSWRTHAVRAHAHARDELTSPRRPRAPAGRSHAPLR